MACVKVCVCVCFSTEHDFPRQETGLCGVISELVYSWSFVCQYFNHTRVIVGIVFPSSKIVYLSKTESVSICHLIKIHCLLFRAPRLQISLPALILVSGPFLLMSMLSTLSHAIWLLPCLVQGSPLIRTNPARLR